tara:strand:- start:1076 stop:1624 length:549 start_codon:yes stop_codon:yes gene_type:complete
MLAGNDAFSPIPPSAYDHLETITLTTSAASVTFSGLGAYSEYTHLQVRSSLRVVNAGLNGSKLTVNGDGAGNYNWHRLTSTGSSVAVSNGNQQTSMYPYYTMGSNGATGYFSSAIIDFSDFSNPYKNLTVRSVNGVVDSTANVRATYFASGAWQNTSAVTSITFGGFVNYEVASSWSLYGVR